MALKMTMGQRILFWIKSRLLIMHRMVIDSFNPISFYRPNLLQTTNANCLCEVITELYTLTDPKEQVLQLGKIQNLRVAVRQFDGITIPADGVFSFWRQMGRPSARKGFVVGRELRQGCLIPTLAGGICQLSNSLYYVAKHSGMEILERHGHTQPIEGSDFAAGDDATVFWNYVDLRFRVKNPVCVRASLTASKLVVRLEQCNA